MERRPYDTLKVDEVIAALGLSRPALYALIRAKKFPPGIPTSEKGGTIVWLWKDVESYLHLQSRIHQGVLKEDKDEE